MEQGHHRLYKLKFTTTTQKNEINLSTIQSSNYIFTSLIILLKCTTSYISVLTQVKTIYCTPTLQSLLNIRSWSQIANNKIIPFDDIYFYVTFRKSLSMHLHIFSKEKYFSQLVQGYIFLGDWARVSRFLYWQSDGYIPQNCYCPHLGAFPHLLF